MVSKSQKRSEKSGQKTVERVFQRVKENPHITQAGLVAELNITRSTIQKHLASLKASGRVRRVGPDKGGHWEVWKVRGLEVWKLSNLPNVQTPKLLNI